MADFVEIRGLDQGFSKFIRFLLVDKAVENVENCLT